jgi:hypothetical protein
MMPDLWEILESHGMRGQDKKVIEKPKEQPVQPQQRPPELQTPVKRIVLKADDARKLFVDLPKQHRFWLKSGKKLKNLMELFEELKIMPEQVFSQHVSEDKNDFASWVKDVYRDDLLAKQLESVETREEHIVTIGNRIEDMKTSLEKAKRKDRPAHIRPNLEFIRKSFDKPDIPKSLETRRRIVPKSLKPDFSFIKLDHAYLVQEKKIRQEMDSLKDELLQLEEQIGHRKSELEELMHKITAKEKKAFEMEKHVQEKESHILAELQEKEKAMQEELSKLEGFEAQIMKRADRLMIKEKEIAGKHSIIARKHQVLHARLGVRAQPNISAMIESARALAKAGKFKEAKQIIIESRKLMTSSRMPEDERRKVFRRLLELSTEVNLAMLR